jgi:hypothetical protein
VPCESGWLPSEADRDRGAGGESKSAHNLKEQELDRRESRAQERESVDGGRRCCEEGVDEEEEGAATTTMRKCGLRSAPRH